jgi:NADPH:quinone reductase-like Zn-dependent oxidoreductase
MTQPMKAMVYRKYGAPEVLQPEEIPRPEPASDQVLIKVFATTATAACGMMRRGDTLMARLILGALAPRARFRVLGIELAGVIEAIGDKVTRFRPGDRVFGFAGFSPGAYAQYCCLRESASLEKMPANLGFEEAASLVDGPTTALYFLRELAKIKHGDKILIIGASGSIGTAAVQLARLFGAEVTGVCSGCNAALITSLGAHHAIDYTREDFTKSDKTYDIIFDTIGKSSFSRCKPSLSKGGRYLLTVGGFRHLVYSALSKIFGDKRLVVGMSIEKRESLRYIASLCETGEFKSTIDRRYKLEQIAQAHRYVEAGHKKGNVVITVEHPSSR